MKQIENTAEGIQQRSYISRLPFYYGWVILIAGAIGVLASIPGQTMGVSVFTDHLITSLNISRVGISSAYMVGTLGSSLIISYAGVLFDRYGARPVAAVAAFFLSLFLLLLVFSSNITSLLASFGIPTSIAAFAVIGFGFFGIRFFGQGVLTLVSRGMVAKWFSTHRGLATGLMGLTTSFAFSYAPQPLQQLISQFGWRSALGALSAMLMFLFLPFILTFFRSDPESCGLEMERGLPKPKKNRSARSEDAHIELDLKDARRHAAYWVILLSLGYWSLFNTAFTFHIVSIYGEFGIDASQAVKIFLPISVISVISRFLGSYLSDRIAIKYLYIMYGISLIIASLSMMMLHTVAGTVLVIIGYGIGTGLFGMLNIVTWPKLYGRKHLGAVSGFAMSIIVAGSAIGPWAFSLVYRFTHSYQGTGIIGLAVSSFIMLAILFIPFSTEKNKKRSNP
ncbi:MFS transporter [uncultured Sphaerochaeta sp.]|uniref:MFS transporter n=1 Tax=uncultured Sphaerochaeta sp. TaxID=886478 RepID=UPI002AA89CCA|nr:MFS transporter [uncultured Sphaerochaeta sp.]